MTQFSVVKRLRQKILKLDLLIDLLSENLFQADMSIESRVVIDRSYKEAINDLRRAIAAQSELEFELNLITTYFDQSKQA